MNNKLLNSVLLLFSLLFVIGCELFEQEIDGVKIARVNENYLYESDLEGLLTDDLSKADSTIRVNNFINQWATQQLLISGAQLNLSESQQSEFLLLVEEYKNDLLIKAYLEGLVKQNIDTTISENELMEVYELHKESFKLNEDLLKLRYININENNSDIDEIEERFKRFDSLDRRILDSIAIQFNSYSLKDSIWIKADQVVQKIPVIDTENKKELLKKSNFIELKDSIEVYLIRINDVRLRNDIAPAEYVRPTLNKIILNKRELEFIQQLENDITRDAIKNNQFEIYN